MDIYIEKENKMILYDLERLFNTIGIPYKNKGKNVGKENINITCPFCDDPSFHCGVRYDGIFHCWRCNESGNIKKLVKTLGYYKSLKPFILNNKEEINTNKIQGALQELFNQLYPIDSLYLSKQYVLKYLQNRDIPFEYYKNWYVSEKNTYYLNNYVLKNMKYRIIIPIIENNEIVNFIARTFVNLHPKYFNCPNEIAKIPLNKLFYKTDIITNKYIILTEGIFDAITFRYNAYALLGKSLSNERIIQLKYFDNIILALDNDVPIEQIKKYAEKLSILNKPIYMIKPDKNVKDFNELGYEKTKNILNKLINKF